MVDVIVFNSHGVGQICHVKRLPRLGETMEATNWRVEEDGGKGATVSVALGRLGIKTGYIGKVGQDPWGEMGDKWMSEAGVDTKYMYKDKNVATGTGLIMVDEDGLNTIVDGDSACKYLTEEEIRNGIDGFKEARFFITGFGMPSEKALFGAKIAKEEYNMTTFCNASPLPSEGLGKTEFIDFLVVNDVEAKIDLGLTEDDETLPKDLAENIIKKHSCKGVIITYGPGGSFVHDGKDYWHVKAPKVEAIDTIGAGDGYLAAFVANLVWGKSLKEASVWATNYASYKVTRKGSMTKEKGKGYPFIEEVNEYFLDNNY